MNFHLTPIGQYIEFKELEDVDCKLADQKDLYIAIYAKNSAQFSKLLSCLNYTDWKNLNWGSESQKREISKFEKLYKNILEKKYDNLKTQGYLEKLKSYNNVIARLLEAYLYILSGNSGRAEIIILKIFEQDLVAMSLSSDIKDIPFETTIEYTVHILKSLKKESFSPAILRNLGYYLMGATSPDFAQQIRKEMDLSTSSSYLRQQSASIIFGYDFPYVWFPLLLRKNSENELKKFLNKTDFFGQQNNFKSLVFYRFFNKLNKNERNSFFKALEGHDKLTGFYEKFLYFDLVEREAIFNLISAHQDLKFGLLVNQKREFFRKSLKKKNFMEMSLYYLVSLGDINKDYIKMLLKFKEY